MSFLFEHPRLLSLILDLAVGTVVGGTILRYFTLSFANIDLTYPRACLIAFLAAVANLFAEIVLSILLNLDTQRGKPAPDPKAHLADLFTVAVFQLFISAFIYTRIIRHHKTGERLNFGEGLLLALIIILATPFISGRLLPYMAAI